MSKHQQLVKDAEAAITAVFADSSVSTAQAEESLAHLQGDIQVYLSVLHENKELLIALGCGEICRLPPPTGTLID